MVCVIGNWIKEVEVVKIEALRLCLSKKNIFPFSFLIDKIPPPRDFCLY
jgi:hypothetical protein